MAGSPASQNYLLLIGDALVLGIVTLYGFASHGTLSTAGHRILATFIPLLAAWFLIAPHLRLFDRQVISDWRQLWRPFWAMMLAAPMAAILRGLLLGSPLLPIFVVVLGGVSSLALLVWRLIVWAYVSRTGRAHG
jgi:hypothetical protein